MITAHKGHFLHLDCLQPLSSATSLSHIELDATKTPLALLAQTCSQIGQSDALSSTKPLSDSKDSERLKISNISFQSKSVEKKDSERPADPQCILWTQKATCRPCAICSPKIHDEDETNDKKSSRETSEMSRSGSSEQISSKIRYGSERIPSSSETSAVFSTSPSLGLGVPPFPTLPFPPFPRSCVSFPQPLLPALNNKPGTSVVSSSPCGDPYCLSYHCSVSLKPTFPLLYPSHSLPSSSMSAFMMFPHGLVHPHDLQSCVFNGVSTTPSETNLSSSHIALTLKNPHQALGPGTRYHPYFKNTFPTPSHSFYSLHGL